VAVVPRLVNGRKVIQGAKKRGNRIVAGPVVQIAGFTEADPSSLKGSSGLGAAVGSVMPGQNFISGTLVNTGVVSNLPSTCLRYTRSSVGIKGNTARASDTRDAFQEVFGLTSTTVAPTDLCYLWWMTDNTVGYGGGIISVAGAWRVYGLTQAAGVWTKTDAAGTAASGVGSRSSWLPNSAATTSRAGRCTPIGTDLRGITTTANATISLGPVTLADGLSTFGIGVGWNTGVGGSAGQAWDLIGAEVLGELGDLFATS
jgi:hypothetical protein